MAVDRVSAQDLLQNIKQKGTEVVRATTDLIYTAEAQLKGATFQDIVNRGKVAAWNAMGMLGEDQTAARDVVYQHRLRGLHRTRRIVEQIDKEFSQLVTDTAALGVRFSKLCTLLNNFRNCCDVHILLSVEEEQEIALKETANDGFVDVADMVTVRSNDKTASEREDDQKIQLFQTKMKRMIAELRETVEVNCKGICQATLADLDRAHHEVVHDVTQAETAVDLQRHKVESAKRSLRKLKEEVNTFSDGTRSKAQRVMQLEQGEAGLGAKMEESHNLQLAYQQAVLQGRSNLHFALEQSSMSTWSMYNIFFSQMTNFFDEAARESQTVAKAFTSLKNMQSVSKRISEEKRQRLAAGVANDSFGRSSLPQEETRRPPACGGAETTFSATAPPAESAIARPISSSAPAVVADDEFENFMSTRHGSETRTEHIETPASGNDAPVVTNPQHMDVWRDLFA